MYNLQNLIKYFQTNILFRFFLVFLCSCGCLFCIFLWDQDPDNLYHLKCCQRCWTSRKPWNYFILTGNREIKLQQISHDVKTANFNSRKFKWGYSKVKQNNTLVSGIPPTLAKWGRPWYFLCKKKNKIKNKTKYFYFLLIYYVNCFFFIYNMYIVVTHKMYLK